MLEKAKQNNQSSGIILTILITFTLIAVNPLWYGAFLYRDVDFAIGLFFGVLFALKFRDPDQSPLKFGIKVGFTAGVFASIIPGFYLWFLFGGHFIILIFNILFLLITGVPLGLIIGGFLGWYYMSKVSKVDEEEKYGDDFFEDLIEK